MLKKNIGIRALYTPSRFPRKISTEFISTQEKRNILFKHTKKEK